MERKLKKICIIVGIVSLSLIGCRNSKVAETVPEIGISTEEEEKDLNYKLNIGDYIPSETTISESEREIKEEAYSKDRLPALEDSMYKYLNDMSTQKLNELLKTSVDDIEKDWIGQLLYYREYMEYNLSGNQEPMILDEYIDTNGEKVEVQAVKVYNTPNSVVGDELPDIDGITKTKNGNYIVPDEWFEAYIKDGSNIYNIPLVKSEDKFGVIPYRIVYDEFGVEVCDIPNSYIKNGRAIYYEHLRDNMENTLDSYFENLN